jgi:NAD(P)-dependent dehydrogenase (short-subunit alcohol dehydrogenase family)
VSYAHGLQGKGILVTGAASGIGRASVANTGQVSSRIVEILPVADVIRGTWDGARNALSAAAARLG